MYTYLIILLLIWVPPFFAFMLLRNKLNFQNQLKPIIGSIFLVSAFFIAWDIVATGRGHWSFSPELVIGTRLLGLPIEEILFFPAVGFAMLFLYLSLRHFVEQKHISLENVYFVLGIAMLCFAVLNTESEYSFFVALLSGLFLVLISLCKWSPLYSKKYVVYIAIGFLLFLLFNFLLTSIPVVNYGDEHINGIRLLSIPVEDFLYNYLLLTAFVITYEIIKK